MFVYVDVRLFVDIACSCGIYMKHSWKPVMCADARIQWKLSIMDTLNRGHLCCLNHTELYTCVPVN